MILQYNGIYNGILGTKKFQKYYLTYLDGPQPLKGVRIDDILAAQYQFSTSVWQYHRNAASASGILSAYISRAAKSVFEVICNSYLFMVLGVFSYNFSYLYFFNDCLSGILSGVRTLNFVPGSNFSNTRFVPNCKGFCPSFFLSMCHVGQGLQPSAPRQWARRASVLGRESYQFVGLGSI
ncbi:hypothetical protein BS78_01G299100 [Paspalum vaginatum]|nr:hypothetical protein BS78_01G299100 [Paspalum vaginatum]